jgi:hypothetical protein
MVVMRIPNKRRQDTLRAPALERSLLCRKLDSEQEAEALEVIL